ncbi:hypothetical protein Tco_0392894 [Tanacetum coccineum]
MLRKYLDTNALAKEGGVEGCKVETQERSSCFIQVIMNGMSLVEVVFKHPLLKNILHINSVEIPEANLMWSLHCPIYRISDYLINYLAHIMGNIEILQVV